jgi:hypothetical protein
MQSLMVVGVYLTWFLLFIQFNVFVIACKVMQAQAKLRPWCLRFQHSFAIHC